MGYKISIIMPVYNAARFLKEAMDSLIDQTIGFENLQVIMVDDCSTDDSLKMMQAYAKQYSNVETYRTEVNSGAGGTPRNIGLEYVNAPYIMFLDPDDFYDKDACRTLHEKIVETNAEIVGGYYGFVTEQGRQLEHVCPLKEERVITCPEQIIEAFEIGGGFSNRIYDARFIDKSQIRFTSEGFGEDTAFTCKCLACSCRCMYIPQLILNYRQNDESVTHVLSEKYFAKCIPSTLEIREILAPYPQAQQYKLEELGAGYFEKSVSARNLDAQALAGIYTKYADLFIKPAGYMTPEYTLALKLITSGDVELAAEYALAVREFEARYARYESIIRQHEDRLISRLADAINQRRFGDAVKICFSAIKSRLQK